MRALHPEEIRDRADQLHRQECFTGCLRGPTQGWLDYAELQLTIEWELIHPRPTLPRMCERMP